MPKLIYDIGLHDGRDTAHYLKEGARVVAVEANPVMCAAGEKNFGDFIRAGQLTIVNRGIAERKGQLEFWVCDDESEWSSFHREIASRNGARHHAITIDCVPIMDLIGQFGVPEYMKIDIEGSDRVCIAGLTQSAAPAYISIEMDHDRGDQDLRRLAELGYRNFKVICQNNAWHQATMRNMWFYRLGPAHFLARRITRLRHKLANRRQGRRVKESGPWGESTSGSWHSLDHALAVWRSLRDIERLGWWFDVHAKR